MSLLDFVASVSPGRWLLKRLFTIKGSSSGLQCCGIQFDNPVGLAAGFDKDGDYLRVLKYLGFGFIEVGTVTPEPQSGNQKPRLFRLPKDHALINRMGFNNKGVRHMKENLMKRPKDLVVGVNIGKNKSTPNEKAVQDYLHCMEELHPFADYFTVNISSPNTPGLRDLQQKDTLWEIVSALTRVNQAKDRPKPLFIKIAPDLSGSEIDDIVDVVNQSLVAGIIATNTTIKRENLKTSARRVSSLGTGGLSGYPLLKEAEHVISHIAEKLEKGKILIGVGGIMSPADAMKYQLAGAKLIQIYTGLIYRGPALVRKIIESIPNTEH